MTSVLLCDLISLFTILFWVLSFQLKCFQCFTVSSWFREYCKVLGIKFSCMFMFCLRQTVENNEMLTESFAKGETLYESSSCTTIFCLVICLEIQYLPSPHSGAE